ncbi:GIY-YIG nuclease family protein [Pacificimonas flava]|nr:GIY-YIG nuclease family protein [Pacificimonas flava]
MPGYTYIMASRKQGTLYIGVTADLPERTAQHRRGEGSAFTRRYKCHRLVWYEEFASVDDAIACEKRMKDWKRAWKVEAIEKRNPDWFDLSRWLHA